VQLLSASLDITFYYNFYIKVVMKTSDIKKSKRTKLERTAMITLKKKERRKQKDEKRKKISGRLRHSLGWVQQLRGIIKGRKGRGSPCWIDC